MTNFATARRWTILPHVTSFATARRLTVPVVLVLGLMGCSDQVRAPTEAQLDAFDRAGSITPVVDVNRVEKAQLKTGPYRVILGDVLEFTMPSLLQAVTAAEVQAAKAREQGAFPYMSRVRDDGTITLPAVGSLSVAGLSLAQIEELVANAYKEYVVLQPSVFVRVAEYKTSKVYITGAVVRPGVYMLQSDQMTLSYLLTVAGGISQVGAAVVRIVRSADADRQASGGSAARDVGRPTSPDTSSATDGRFPIRAGTSRATDDRATMIVPVASTNIPYRDVSLDEGDTVVVQPVQMPLFSVLGLVTRPGNIPYPPDAQYNVAQAIAYAGGLDPVAQPRYVTIYRLNEDGSAARVPFELIKANGRFTDVLGTPIRPGDVVAVEHTPRTRWNLAVRDLFRLNVGLYVRGEDVWGNNND